MEETLVEEVKVTLLATGFSITSVPGIQEEEEETKAEELQRKIQEGAKRAGSKRQGADREILWQSGLESLAAHNYRLEPFVLTAEELDDDRVLEALEKNPVFKRKEILIPVLSTVTPRVLRDPCLIKE